MANRQYLANHKKIKNDLSKQKYVKFDWSRYKTS